MIVPQQPSWQLAVSRRLGLVCASLALIVLVAQASPPSEVSDASEQLEEWVPSCYPFCGMEVVVHKGYGLERHYATTPDGYILGLFRLLPRGEKSAARLARSPPLVLQHALLDSSFAWVSNYHKNQSLALLASDAGYDVWLGNNRGNVYSRNHTRLDPDADAAFWDFTFEDMATADLPATLRYVLEHRAAEAAAAGGGGGGGGGGARGGGGGSGGGGSGGGGDDGGGGGGDGGGGGGKGSVSTRLRLPARSIGFIGHSEGTMQGFAGFSLAENAEVAEAVALFGALAPVAFLSGIDSPVVSGMAANHVDGLASWLGLTELLPGSRLNGFSSPLCSWVPLLCDGVLDLVTGASDNLNLTHLPVQLAHTPAGTSAKNLAHFMQGIRDGHFRRFDYGDEAENARRYNATRPPDFPLAAGFKVPVAMWSGARDSLATPADVARLQEALAPTGRVVHHAEVDFAHLDFTWSTRAAEAVYQPLLCMMRARLPPERGPCAAEAAAEPTPGPAAEPAAERRRSGVLQ